MHRYQILIEYVGTHFIGWQIQIKGQSVQKLIQNKYINIEIVLDKFWTSIKIVYNWSGDYYATASRNFKK